MASAPAKPAIGLNPAKFVLPVVLATGYTAFLWTVWKSVEGTHNPFGACSVITPIVMTALYLLMVFTGPKLMGSSPAWDPKEFILVYNFFQSALNLWIVLAFLYQVIMYEPSFWLFGYDLSSNKVFLGFIIWVHYNNKYIEFLDSVFMIVRKKDSQLSFLHCYHHCIMPWAWWMVCHFACGGDAFFGAMMNSFIHVLMYFYYGIASLVSAPSLTQSQLMGQQNIRPWWKKYLTSLQMIQFVICATHSAIVCWAGDATYPRWLTFVELFVMFNMLYLFNKFYKQQYANRKAAAAQPSKKQA